MDTHRLRPKKNPGLQNSLEWVFEGAIYTHTPHSLRTTTATLLPDANVDIIKVKDLLVHRHATTMQMYDKRHRSTSESASHLLAI